MSRQTLSIETPEGIAFSLPLAGPVTRCLAWVIDAVLIVGLCMVAAPVSAVLGLISADAAQALAVLLYFVIQVGYGIALEYLWRGQTLGKRLLRLRVVDAQGLRLQFSQVVVRNLLRFVDALPAAYLLGGVACLLSPRAQRLGDLAANTVVLRHPRLVEPDFSQVASGKYNSLLDSPHLAARLRQQVTPAEAALALQALLRRESFDGDARVRLFEELALHFQSLVQFPPEAVEGISHEQYVRNVVAVLYRRPGQPRPVG